MAGGLNDFLGEETQAPEPEAVVVPEIVVEKVAEPAVKPATVEKTVEPEAADDLPDDVVKLRAALVATRRDHKGRADRAEGEAAALRAQLAEFQKARAEPVSQPAAPQAVQAFPSPPNPQEDPQGYADWVETAQFNRRANLSEQAIKADKSVTDLQPRIQAFMEAKGTNPMLDAQLRLAPDPWRWAYEQGGRILAERESSAQRDTMLKEIGTDPEAYKAKLRAEWEAERGAAPRVPEVVLPQSLAGARNSGERTQAEQTAPEFDSIFDKGRFARAKQV